MNATVAAVSERRFFGQSGAVKIRSRHSGGASISLSAQSWLPLAAALALSSCGQAKSGGDFAGHAPAVATALQQVRALASYGAQATECAFTLGAKQPSNRESGGKEKLIGVLDAAEGATGACDRAAGEFLRLNESCRDRWEPNCDYLVARIGILFDTAKERLAAACTQPAPDAPPK